MTQDAAQPYDLRRARQAQTAAWVVVIVAFAMIVAVVAGAVLVRA